jgi:hypothetical protein
MFKIKLINKETPFLRFGGFATVFIKLTKFKLKLNWGRERDSRYIVQYISQLENYQIQIEILTKKKSLVNHNDFYWWNISSLFLSVYIDINFSSVNIKKNTVGNKGMKKIKCHYYR